MLSKGTMQSEMLRFPSDFLFLGLKKLLRIPKIIVSLENTTNFAIELSENFVISLGLFLSKL